jgi:hypothetical protein
VSHVFTGAKNKALSGAMNLATADVRAKLLMTNNTAKTQVDAANLAAITTLDEYNGSGYAEAVLGSKAVASDTTNHRGWFDAADFTFGATVAAGTRAAQGILVYVRVDGTAANDYPVAWIDTGGFPFSGSGGPVNVTVDVNGLVWAS